MKQLLTNSDATTSPMQHTSPCSDCPFSRKSLNGWLGGSTVEEWLGWAHSNTFVNCHVISNQQCAGLAIYRRNVLRLPINPLLVLEADRKKVFATPTEFTDHHASKLKAMKKK